MNTSERLRRFWLRLDPARQVAVGFQLGCGITALNREDALHLLRSVYPPRTEFVVLDWIDDVEINSLEPRHVLPNIGDTTKRGVWFPNFGPTYQH